MAREGEFFASDVVGLGVLWTQRGDIGGSVEVTWCYREGFVEVMWLGREGFMDVVW